MSITFVIKLVILPNFINIKQHNIAWNKNNEKNPNTASVLPTIADGCIGVGMDMGVIVGEAPDSITCVGVLVLVIEADAFTHWSICFTIIVLVFLPALARLWGQHLLLCYKPL